MAGAPAHVPPRQEAEAGPTEFWSAWDDFFAALRRARGRDARQASGLTISQYHLLSAVAANPTAGLRELAEQVGSSAPTVTRMLTSLERAGIVSREPAATAPRRVCVSLTGHGRAILAHKHADMDGKRAAIFASLSPDERRQIELMMPRLAQALDAL
jgi:DNA-binding MarR family transcriptional regulator